LQNKEKGKKKQKIRIKLDRKKPMMIKLEKKIKKIPNKIDCN
jgi:hypothetical protein